MPAMVPEFRHIDARAFGVIISARSGPRKSRSSGWVGDLWVFGGHHYGERARAAAEGIFGRSFQGLRDVGFVARAFETSRRRDTLAFTHQREVAALPAAEADALLDAAEAEG